MLMTDAQAMLEDCLNRESKLNDWEKGFVQSLTELDDVKKMSPRQYETLEKIWDRVT